MKKLKHYFSVVNLFHVLGGINYLAALFYAGQQETLAFITLIALAGVVTAYGNLLELKKLEDRVYGR